VNLATLYSLWEARGRLFTLHLDLTWRCPLACVHCYLDSHRDAARNELSTSEWISLLEEARDLGVFSVLFSGGETFVRKDLFAILEAGRAMRFLLRLKTSGVLVGREEARHLAELKPIVVEVTLHGATPETHDAVAGVKGAFERTMAGVRYMHEAGVDVRVVTVAMANTIGETMATIGVCQSLGVPARAYVSLQPTADGRRLDALEASMDEKARVLAALLEDPKAAPRPPKPEEPLCGAARTALYISPSGQIQPCVMWPTVLGNAREGIAKAYESPAARLIRGLSHGDREGCKDCELYGFCGFCAACSVLEHGDPRRPNRTSCGLAAVRRRAGEL